MAVVEDLLPPSLKPHAGSSVFLAALALAVLLLTFLAIKLVGALLGGGGGGGGGGGRKAVLVGPCNGGKTTLFHQLVHRGLPEGGTVASMQENEGSCPQLKGIKTIVDVAGHERLRTIRDEHLKDCKCIVFVVDSCAVEPHKVETAEELFEVLTHPAVARRKTPILIACNKADLEAHAHSLDFISRTLERQLDAMRRTRVSLSPEAAARAAVLGKTDRPFSLMNLRNPILLAPLSALNGDMDEVWNFLLSNDA